MISGEQTYGIVANAEKVKWLCREIFQKFPLLTNADHRAIDQQVGPSWSPRFLLARKIDEDLTEFEKQLLETLEARGKARSSEAAIKTMTEAVKYELPHFSTKKTLLSKN